MDIQLQNAVQDPDHWLEGAIFSDQQNLRELNLLGANLPRADFENVDLSDTVLAEACLDDAVFREAILNATIFSGSSLTRAVLTGAIGRGTQFENADLSDANLSGIRLQEAHLSGIKLSQGSNTYDADWGTIKELTDCDFRKAANTLRQLALQLRQIDTKQADRFYYQEMTARHLWEVRARAYPGGSYYGRCAAWFAPTVHHPTKCLLWALHRWVWGYAIRPLRTLAWMAAVILAFAVVYHRIGITGTGPEGSSLWQALALSLITFSTLGYGNRTPYGVQGEVLGGFEAIAGMLLSSMFLVALVNRYAQRG